MLQIVQTLNVKVLAMLYPRLDFVDKEDNFAKTELKDFIIPNQKDPQVFPRQKNILHLFACHRKQLLCRNQGLSYQDDLSSSHGQERIRKRLT